MRHGTGGEALLGGTWPPGALPKLMRLRDYFSIILGAADPPYAVQRGWGPTSLLPALISRSARS